MYLTGHSLTEGYLPASQKRAIVFPTLKKQNLDQNACQNYRPISSLSFLSKTLERLVSLQLLPYFEQAGLLPAAQSVQESPFHRNCSLIPSVGYMYLLSI